MPHWKRLRHLMANPRAGLVVGLVLVVPALTAAPMREVPAQTDGAARGDFTNPAQSAELLWPLPCDDHPPVYVPREEFVDPALVARTAASREEPWVGFGPYFWGVRYYDGTLVLGDLTLDHRLQIWYPATAEGEETPVATAGAPYPVLFFEHAAGSHYTYYDFQFSRLASHGIIVISAYHDGPWDSGPGGLPGYWSRHRQLFDRTIRLVFHWNSDPASPFFGRLDADRLGLGGHCHGAGAAVMAARDFAPLVPESPFTIRSVCLLANCLTDPVAALPSLYADTPPLQVIYGSKDEEGCVSSYGHGVAIYEAGRRPRQFMYLIGANHYVFCEGGGLGESTITREEAFRATGAAMSAFHAWLLNHDESALPYLRGDLPLLDEGPEMRLQFHDEEFAPVHDFEEGANPEPSVAIAGIPGQTFVNGFLSDTFVDFEAGVDLVRAEIQALLADEPGCHAVLYYLDVALGDDVYAEALAREVAAGLICEPLTTSSQSAFATLITSQPWDLIVAANQGGSSGSTHPFDVPLATYICGGGRAIVSEWRIYSPSAAETLACSATAFDGRTNWLRMTATSGLFSGELQLYNPGWGILSVALDTQATVFATSELMGEVVPFVPEENNLGLPVVSSGAETFIADQMLQPSRTLYHPNWGVEFAWDTPGAGFVETLNLGQGLDASAWHVLSFRVLQIHDDPLNPEGELQDLYVRLTDADGHTAELALADAWQGPLRPAVVPRTGIPWKSVYETYRLPLDDFAAAWPEIDLRRLVTLAFTADITETGRLVIDDVELAGPVCVPGDVNCDGLFDGSDLSAFAACMAGPGTPPTCGPPETIRADLEHDGDVDLGDFADVQRAPSAK